MHSSIWLSKEHLIFLQIVIGGNTNNDLLWYLSGHLCSLQMILREQLLSSDGAPLREQKMQRCRRPGRRKKCSTARRSARRVSSPRNVSVRGCSAGRVTPPPAVARAPHTYHHRAVGRRACMCRPRPLRSSGRWRWRLGPGRRHQLPRRCRQPAIFRCLA